MAGGYSGMTMTNSKTFKNINGVYFLRELFFETAQNRDNVIYTLKREDHTVDGVTYESLHRLFLEADDVTEYQFALSCLDSWDHWSMLSNCTWFQPYILRWREELEVKQRSRALATIMAASKGPTRDAFVAAKYIAEGWDKPKTGRGRPSKVEIKQEAQRIVEDKTKVDADYLRLIQG